MAESKKSTTAKYRNISDQEQVVSGIGTVEAGGEIEAPADFSNPNFEEVGKAKTAKKAVEPKQPDPKSEDDE